MRLSDTLVIVRGAGALGSGAALRLARAGFTVMLTELAQPLTLWRGAALAEAVYAGQVAVEDLTARLADDPMLGLAYTVMGELPLVVDLTDDVASRMRPGILVDARPAPRRPPARRNDAKLVIGLGPGFTAGDDCHAVVETQPGRGLGRVYWEDGAAEPQPGDGACLLRAPSDGVFHSQKNIGDAIYAGEAFGGVEGQAITAGQGGVLTGLLHDGVPVAAGMTVAAVDPQAAPDDCFQVSEQARAVGGGVLEAILAGINLWTEPEEDRDEFIPSPPSSLL